MHSFNSRRHATCSLSLISSRSQSWIRSQFRCKSISISPIPAVPPTPILLCNIIVCMFSPICQTLTIVLTKVSPSVSVSVHSNGLFITLSTSTHRSLSPNSLNNTSPHINSISGQLRSSLSNDINSFSIHPQHNEVPLWRVKCSSTAHGHDSVRGVNIRSIISQMIIHHPNRNRWVSWFMISMSITSMNRRRWLVTCMWNVIVALLHLVWTGVRSAMVRWTVSMVAEMKKNAGEWSCMNVGRMNIVAWVVNVFPSRSFVTTRILLIVGMDLMRREIIIAHGSCASNKPAFACDDVACMNQYLFEDDPIFSTSCDRNRHLILGRAMFTIRPPSISVDCWLAVNCLVFFAYLLSPDCEPLNPYVAKLQAMQKDCPELLLLPSTPIAFGHAYFLYDFDGLKPHSASYY